jgi:hypothetical protein
VGSFDFFRHFESIAIGQVEGQLWVGGKGRDGELLNLGKLAAELR